ncbi:MULTISPECIES: Rap1a/Tai family immunity protein [unclassified Sinorhizobium]|uniref:Rap1a/Tai family immunity protein n=1 Tax=unclassified Sinorhizobium TaxID=2613772 RepID=UPI0035267B9C
MKKLVSAVALIWLYAQPTLAYFVSGNDIYQLCESQEPGDGSSAMYYIWGVYDSEKMQLALGTATKKYQICLSPEVTAAELYDVVCKWLGANPKYRNEPASILLRGAMVKAWPCR